MKSVKKKKMKKMRPSDEMMVRRLKLKYRIRHQQKILAEDIEYVKHHAGTLTLSGLGHLFFPALRNKRERGVGNIKDYFTTFSGTGKIINDAMPFILGAASPALLRGLFRSIFRKRK